VVVVCGEVCVAETLGGITGAPFCVHHLDVQVVIGCDAEAVFGVADALRVLVSLLLFQRSGHGLL
jgi:uncharacterized protein (DUF1810 family)